MIASFFVPAGDLRRGGQVPAHRLAGQRRRRWWTRGGRVVGIVTRQILDAAIQHELGARPVDTVMTRELEWVDPQAPAEEVGERMLTRHPRFVLVRWIRRPAGRWG